MLLKQSIAFPPLRYSEEATYLSLLIQLLKESSVVSLDVPLLALALFPSHESLQVGDSKNFLL